MDTSWSEHFELPEPHNMMMNTPKAKGIFIRQGTRMATAICDTIKDRDKPNN